jgi:hypothetical protein
MPEGMDKKMAMDGYMGTMGQRPLMRRKLLGVPVIVM